MLVIIDRFEGNFVVVELTDKTIASIPKVLVPDSKEGDVIRIEVDEGVTKERKDKIEKLRDDVWE